MESYSGVPMTLMLLGAMASSGFLLGFLLVRCSWAIGYKTGDVGSFGTSWFSVNVGVLTAQVFFDQLPILLILWHEFYISGRKEEGST